ncbi:glycosyltransferase [Flavobacterium sp. LS1R10]|uniref:glycosyltransferase n=1 Tax=Flavobacterium sp. LS1R10 TaxID=2497482 RepID=UPI000F81BFA6|nr:glycosyltransferase [Flavobacterium sp. LS1R10]RTY76345.1 glycosyltransferase [Flavobacterium sp. LS1R10]
MKVVHIIEALGGGIYTYFEDLTHHFEKEIILQKVQTSILYSANRKEIDPEKVTQLFATIPTVKIEMRREINFISDLKALQKLVFELQKIKPDIVHLHSSKAGVLGRIACGFLNPKPNVFYTPHGYAFLRTDISTMAKKGYWYIEKFFQKFFGGITIACGDSEFEMAKQLGKAEMIRNGIDISAIENYSQAVDNTKLTIGIAGRITAARNPRQFNAIALQFPEYQFVWIGDGEERDKITAPNIKITGWFIEKKQVYEQINALDIYLQTSLWEGLPIAVLEAMALQKPIIATKINGNKDTVVHKETGFLYQELSELSLYFKILEDSKVRAQFGNNGKTRCKDLFNTTINFTALQKLYERYFFAAAKNFQK